MIFVALSCLQGRPMADAFDALLSHGAQAIQLTPGNHPTPNFERHVAARGVPVRTHQGFSFTSRAGRVWTDDGSLACASDSVHAPKSDQADQFWTRLEHHGAPTTLEVMYPSYCLGSGDDLERAMSLGLPLAVDVSHLFIQQNASVLSSSTLRRVLDYARIEEVHVSANDGRHDSHRLLSSSSFGLGWAREREAEGTPIVFESYLHAVPPARWSAQLELIHG